MFHVKHFWNDSNSFEAGQLVGLRRTSQSLHRAHSAALAAVYSFINLKQILRRA